MRSFDKLRMTTDKLRMTSIIFMLLLFCGCGLFKNNKKVNLLKKYRVKTELRAEQTTQSLAKKNGQSFVLKRDSADKTFAVEIWPIGSFSYSPYKGFEGTAYKIKWYGNASQLSSVLVQQGIQAQKKINAANIQRVVVAKKEQQTVTKKESQVPWEWIVVGVAAVLLLLLRVFMRRSRLL